MGSNKLTLEVPIKYRLEQSSDLLVTHTGMALGKKVQRRRIRTVIQNMMTIATKLVLHSRKHTLCFGRHSPWFTTFQRVYNSITLA